MVKMTMLRSYLLGLTAAVMLVICRPVAAADMDELLDLVPADSEMFAVVPSLSGMNDNIAKLSVATGWEEMAPGSENLLQQVKSAIGLGEGVNDAGAMIAIVGINEKGMEDERTYWLVPVSDYKTFVETKGGSASEAVTSIGLKQEGDTFAKKYGDYALLSPSRKAIDAYQPGKASAVFLRNIGKAGTDYTEKADLFIYVDASTLAETFGPMAIDQMMRDAEESIKPGAPDFEQQQKMVLAYTELVQNLFKTIAQDADAVGFAVRVNENGIVVSESLGFKPESEISSFLPGGPSTAQSLLAQMPAQPWIFTSTIDFKSFNYAKVFEDVKKYFGPLNPLINEMYTAATPIIDKTEGQTTVLYVPNQTSVGGLLNQVQFYKTDNTDALIGDIKGYMQKLGEVRLPRKDFGMAERQIEEENMLPEPEMGFITSWTDDVLDLDGVKVSQYSFTMSLSPEMMQQMGPMAFLLGQGYNGYVAAKDGYVIQTTTLDQQLLQKALDNIGKMDGLGGIDEITRTRAAYLPKNAAMEMYLNISGIANAANNYLPLFEMPPIQVPAGLTPVAMAMGIEDNSTVLVTYVPSDNIKFLIDTVKTLQQTQEVAPPPPGYGPGVPLAPGNNGNESSSPPPPIY